MNKNVSVVESMIMILLFMLPVVLGIGFISGSLEIPYILFDGEYAEGKSRMVYSIVCICLLIFTIGTWESYVLVYEEKGISKKRLSPFIPLSIISFLAAGLLNLWIEVEKVNYSLLILSVFILVDVIIFFLYYFKGKYFKKTE